MRLRLETGFTVILMAIIFTLALTGECSPSLFNEMKGAKSYIIGAYNKVGLNTPSSALGILRFIP